MAIFAQRADISLPILRSRRGAAAELQHLARVQSGQWCSTLGGFSGPAQLDSVQKPDTGTKKGEQEQKDEGGLHVTRL